MITSCCYQPKWTIIPEQIKINVIELYCILVLVKVLNSSLILRMLLIMAVFGRLQTFCRRKTKFTSFRGQSEGSVPDHVLRPKRSVLREN